MKKIFKVSSTFKKDRQLTGGTLSIYIFPNWCTEYKYAYIYNCGTVATQKIHKENPGASGPS